MLPSLREWLRERHPACRGRVTRNLRFIGSVSLLIRSRRSLSVLGGGAIGVLPSVAPAESLAGHYQLTI
jgi:hypothetical protein